MSEWRPISEADTNGKAKSEYLLPLCPRILLRMRDGTITVGYFNPTFKRWWTDYGAWAFAEWQPTHWMHLPDQPDPNNPVDSFGATTA